VIPGLVSLCCPIGTTDAGSSGVPHPQEPFPGPGEVSTGAVAELRAHVAAAAAEAARFQADTRSALADLANRCARWPKGATGPSGAGDWSAVNICWRDVHPRRLVVAFQSCCPSSSPRSFVAELFTDLQSHARTAKRAGEGHRPDLHPRDSWPQVPRLGVAPARGTPTAPHPLAAAAAPRPGHPPAALRGNGVLPAVPPLPPPGGRLTTCARWV